MTETGQWTPEQAYDAGRRDERTIVRMAKAEWEAWRVTKAEGASMTDWLATAHLTLVELEEPDGDRSSAAALVTQYRLDMDKLTAKAKGFAERARVISVN